MKKIDNIELYEMKEMKLTKEENKLNKHTSKLLKMLFLLLLIFGVILVKYKYIEFYSILLYAFHNDILLPKLDYNLQDNMQNITKNQLNYIFRNEYEIPNDERLRCKSYGPFKAFNDRFQAEPIELCRSLKSNHICYVNNITRFVVKNGLACKMENFVLDPSKWKEDGYTYHGPVNNITRGCPILSHGFFNMKCEYQNNISNYSESYDNYIKAWNYNYYYEEKLEELAPRKIIFFISRNQDSPNLFFGGAGIINALAMMYFYKLEPENIQVVFLESMRINNDPYYDLYKLIISRGGEPLHIRDLKKKYHISAAIHVPINWDSPLFILYKNIPICKYRTKAFYYLNKYIDKYINITNFIEPLNYDNETFYYSKSVTDPNSQKYTKYVTFQWRKAWPRGRKGQGRLIGNGPEMVEKLTKILPNNILVRLVDTASLSIIEQISIMRKTDYFIGVHGAGLFLSVFMPTTSILHEISLKRKTNNLLLMSFLSGHKKTFWSIWDAEVKQINGNEYVFFDPDNVANSVIQNMNKSDFFK